MTLKPSPLPEAASPLGPSEPTQAARPRALQAPLPTPKPDDVPTLPPGDEAPTQPPPDPPPRKMPAQQEKAPPAKTEGPRPQLQQPPARTTIAAPVEGRRVLLLVGGAAVALVAVLLWIWLR
ncbi:MAG: hypothetical protein AB1938_17250 [Myxococcota bacterium]